MAYLIYLESVAEQTADFSLNPLLTALRDEGEDDEADITESLWASSSAVTSIYHPSED